MLALSIRRDRTPVVSRKLAEAESDARVSRRILAIANALDAMSRGESAQSAGMDRQTLRDWVIRYNADGIDGLADRPRDGRPPKLDAEEKSEFVRIVLVGPDPEVSGLSAFTREDLVRICKQRFAKSLHVTTVEVTRESTRWYRRGRGSSIQGKTVGDNVGKLPRAAGTGYNLQRLSERG
jgi:transposase